jgi:aminoglycoside phosphotransferase (APT) family kinase protein
VEQATPPPRALAPDDVVADHAQAAANERPPLLVVEPLRRFLEQRGLGAGELRAEEIGEGHSCVTFGLDHGERRLILRRPPRPPVPPSTHDVLREARVLTALQGSDVPVPEVLAVCSDEGVIGAPFYVMAEVVGEVPTTSLPAALETPEQRRLVGVRMVEVLHSLQQVDWRAAGLETFGRPDGYLERQLRRFSDLWETNKTRELPAVSRVADWLRRTMPESPPTTIVHGDYRLGNAMFAPSEPARMAALLDWEMSTLGDPLADLGLMAIRWVEPGDPRTPLELSPVTRKPGFLTRAELVAAYQELSGGSVAAIDWYATLALWKTIVFMEGNYKRTVLGASDDPYVSRFREGVVEIAEWAERVGPGGHGLD